MKSSPPIPGPANTVQGPAVARAAKPSSSSSCPADSGSSVMTPNDTEAAALACQEQRTTGAAECRYARNATAGVAIAPDARLRRSTPGHHRRQPHDELLDRRRIARGARRVPEPEEVALDRVRAGLEAVITRCGAAATTPSTPEQRTDDEAPGLGRKRLAQRPVPATTRKGATRRGGLLQLHRQCPSAGVPRDGQHRRADARGAAGRTTVARTAAPSGARRPDPRIGDCGSVRRAVTVRSGIYVGSCRSRSG
jgi:hypothetical protein